MRFDEGGRWVGPPCVGVRINGGKINVLAAPSGRNRQAIARDGREAEAADAVTHMSSSRGDRHVTREADRPQFLKEFEAFLAKYNPS